MVYHKLKQVQDKLKQVQDKLKQAQDKLKQAQDKLKQVINEMRSSKNFCFNKKWAEKGLFLKKKFDAFRGILF